MIVNALTVDSATYEEHPTFEWALQICNKPSIWSAKVKRLAIFINFFKQWRKNPQQKVNLIKVFPSLDDMKNAQNRLICGIQQEAFPKEMEILNKQLKDNAPQELTLKTSCLK